MCCVLKPDYSKDEPYIKSLDITWRLIRHEESQVSFCIYSFGICILKVPQVFKFTVLWSWKSTVLDRLTIADNYWALLTMDCLLNLFNNLYFSHFTVEQIEAQRSWVTCSKSTRQCDSRIYALSLHATLLILTCFFWGEVPAALLTDEIARSGAFFFF